jgi:hypothetical protein
MTEMDPFAVSRCPLVKARKANSMSVFSLKYFFNNDTASECFLNCIHKHFGFEQYQFLTASVERPIYVVKTF